MNHDLCILRKEMLIVDMSTKILLTTYPRSQDFDKALASKFTVSSGFKDESSVNTRLCRLRMSI